MLCTVNGPVKNKVHHQLYMKYLLNTLQQISNYMTSKKLLSNVKIEI